jgi:hypothetical protein
MLCAHDIRQQSVRSLTPSLFLLASRGGEEEKKRKPGRAIDPLTSRRLCRPGASPAVVLFLTRHGGVVLMDNIWAVSTTMGGCFFCTQSGNLSC